MSKEKKYKVVGPRKYFFDTMFFSSIDSEDKAYFLGLLFADGSLYNDYQVGISLIEEDKHILEEFMRSIKHKGKLSFKKTSKYKNCKKDQYRMLLCSKDLCNDLKNLGCIKNKTKILKFPKQIKENKYTIRHFIRGFFDGDGTLHVNKRKKDSKASIVCASLGFLNSIKKITDDKKIKSSILNKETYHILTYSGNNNCYKFLHWMYDDSSVFLKRKKDKFLIGEKWIDENVKRHPHRRPVLQKSLEGKILNNFESAVHAERNLNIRYQNIRFCCDNSHRTAGGFLWEWA